MNDELVERFKRIETQDLEQGPQDPWYLSRDRVLGLIKQPDYSRFTSLGRFKLKSPRPHKVPVHILGMHFNADLLYRAMHIFHRRKKFEFGLYQMSKQIFAMREGEDIILIAPAIFDSDPEKQIEFKDFVERINKSFFEKWKIWSRILQGKRY